MKGSQHVSKKKGFGPSSRRAFKKANAAKSETPINEKEKHEALQTNSVHDDSGSRQSNLKEASHVEDQDEYERAGLVHDSMFETFDVEGVQRKVLFLKNLSADRISRSDESLSKLVEGFVPRLPKLVIHLCMSKGFNEHVCAVEKFSIKHQSAGYVPRHPPFPSGTVVVPLEPDWPKKLNSACSALGSYFEGRGGNAQRKLQRIIRKANGDIFPLNVKQVESLAGLDSLKLSIRGKVQDLKLQKDRLVFKDNEERGFFKNLDTEANRLRIGDYKKEGKEVHFRPFTGVKVEEGPADAKQKIMKFDCRDWVKLMDLAEHLKAFDIELVPNSPAQTPLGGRLPTKADFPLSVEVVGEEQQKRGRDCEERLDRFMSEIVLPLAIETNAMILCTGLSPICASTLVTRIAESLPCPTVPSMQSVGGHQFVLYP